jgi:hypothetical protein
MIYLGIKDARIVERGTRFYVSHPQNDAILGDADTRAEAETIVAWLNALAPAGITRHEIGAVLEKLDLPLDAAHDEHGGISRALRSAFVKLMALHDSMPRDIGRPSVCAVEGCNKPGKRHTCPADGTAHGHGCIHFEHCHTSLTFRNDGVWHLICDEHYQVCVESRHAWEGK